MGRLTEYYQYLQTDPSRITEFKEKMAWFTITEADKKLRRKLKLYKTVQK